jgi:hypothetical protein
MRTRPGTEATAGARARERRCVPLWVLVICVVVVGLLSPVVALAAAGPTFSDVPESHPFHDEIEWMAKVGITDGYPDGTYRPNRNVTRAEMSAFMKRLNDFQNDLDWAVAEEAISTNSTTFVDIPGATTTVVVPAGASATVTAQLTAVSQVSGVGNGHGAIRFMIARNSGIFVEMPPAGIANNNFDSLGGNDGLESHAIQRAVERQPGTYTVKAQYAVSQSQMHFAVRQVSLIVATDLHP